MDEKHSFIYARSVEKVLKAAQVRDEERMMNNKEYNDLVQGLQEAIEHARGDRVLTVHEIPLPKKPSPMTPAQIVSLRRKKLHLSQAYFAQVLNTSPKTVQAWEQGVRTPSSCALRFLWLLYRKPELAPTVAAAC